MLAILFWLFLISIPFGFRVLLYQFTPGFHEYESVFLYAGDLFLFAFLIFFYFSRFNYWPISKIFKNLRIENRPNWLFPWPNSLVLTVKGAKIENKLLSTALIMFLSLVGVSVLAADYKLLALYNLIRLILLVLSAFAVSRLLEEGFLKLEKIFAAIAGLAVFESLIGALQFYYQKSLGLWFLGESVLGEGIRGVAKIDVDGGHFLRAYGTFPHPNILASFLLLGLFSLFYFWLKRQVEWRGFDALRRLFFSDLLISLSLFIVMLGLVLTFSRAAWFIAAVLSAGLILFLVFDKNYRKQALRLSAVLLVVGYLLFVYFGWAILPRVQISVNEPAVSQRLAYNSLGWNIINNLTDNFLGVGIGNQVIYAVKNNLYQRLGMNESWQWQPIHNIYLLIASEVGIMGLVSFLIFIASILILKKNGKWKTENCILLIMFMALLAFGLFDHFLWTLQPGRLMFWLVIGLMM